MSDPKRFDPLSDGMWENSAGDYVLHSDYAAMLAATQWRLIETAPKDGTEVLCISGEFMFVAWIDSRGHWNSGDDSRFIPDYWMPLPKPPGV